MDPELNEQKLDISQANLIELEKTPLGNIVSFLEYDERYISNEQLVEIEEHKIQNQNIDKVTQMYISIEGHPDFKSTQIIFDKKGTPQFLVFSKEIDETFQLQEDKKEIAEKSTKDPLTNLDNRRGWEIELEKLADDIQRGKLNGKYLVFTALDLNNLKETNDTFGHPEGDKLLIQMAELLRESFRINDEICRWGGDEFAAFSISDVDNPEIIAQRLKNAKGDNLNFCAGIISLSIDKLLQEISLIPGVDNKVRTEIVLKKLKDEIYPKADEISVNAKKEANLNIVNGIKPTVILTN